MGGLNQLTPDEKVLNTLSARSQFDQQKLLLGQSLYIKRCDIVFSSNKDQQQPPQVALRPNLDQVATQDGE